MADLNFGAVQLKIMQVLWDRNRVNAREITAALNENSHSEIAHSTVQTLLRQLELKGAVSHLLEERTFIFYPVVPRQKVVKNEIRQLVNRLFKGSSEGLVAFLLKQEAISQKELEAIKRLIREKESRS
jgi:BlaI family transcriptional regulator, penicillinase repressor